MSYLHSWKAVNEDEDEDFAYLEQEIHTNSSTTSYTIEHLQPYTVYSFQVSAVNHVGRSRPGKNSYPSITLRESKCLVHCSFWGSCSIVCACKSWQKISSFFLSNRKTTSPLQKKLLSEHSMMSLLVFG